MTNLRVRELILSLTCSATLGACGGKAEPDIPTWDPMDKVQSHWGWKVGRSIAVSPGKEKPSVHHVQAIASGLHNVDFEAPPKAFIPIKPSCKIAKPDIGDVKYLIIGDGNAKFSLMKNADVTGVTTFDNKTASALARTQARNMLEKGTRRASLGSGGYTGASPGTTMSMKDIFITETSKSVFVALAGGGLYNFHLAPNVRLTGVVIYTGKTGYNNGTQAAVAGVPDGVPVHFVSQTHKATKGCWVRIQKRPDGSWKNQSSVQSRADAIKPFWKAFFKRVKKDIGYINEEDVISVSQADHFLIGPAPLRYEDRLPYTAFGQKTIHYAVADYINFGTRDQNKTFAKQIVDQYFETHLEKMKK